MDAQRRTREPFRSGLLHLLAAAAMIALGACANNPSQPQPPSQTTAAAPEPPPIPEAPYDHEKSIASFDLVWQTINDKHWESPPAGLDWDAVGAKYRPQIEAATSTRQARRIMEDMLGELHQSHFSIISQEAYLRSEPTSTSDVRDTTPDKPASPDQSSETAPSTDRKEITTKPGRDRGVSGIEVRILDKQAVITSVLPDSPADKAGIRPGWVIVNAAGEDVQRLAARLEKRESKALATDFLLAEMLMHLLAGDVGETVKLDLLDGADQRMSKELVLAETTGTSATLGNLPTLTLRIDSRRIQGNVQYFYFSIFLDPPRLMTAFGKAVEEAKDADGFIVDLRGNPGGLGGLAMGMGGWFIDDDNVKLGTMITRSGKLNFVLNPRLHSYPGPLAILVDGLSGSTSEIFAGGMKDIGRARVFGQRTMGAALPSVIDVLPNGDRFQYAIANYISAGGKPLEGDGVIPDEEIKLERTALLAGHDPTLEAALNWIKAQNAAKTSAPTAR